MSSRIDVSFFIPIYRPNLLWLQEAVESIVVLFRKSTVRCELLLGDDGSPEPVDLDALKAMAPEMIRTWHFSENRGIGAISTDLAKKASGRYIASFDQDDILLPFDLDGEVAFMDNHRQYSASYAQKFLFNGNGLTGEVHGDIYSPFQAFFSPKVNINAMLIRREILASHDYFKPVPGSRINHDVWLMFRMAEDGSYYYSRTPRALYRVHDRQNSNGNNQADWYLIGQDIICRHPRPYRELLLSKNPGTGNSAPERELYHKLSGLVMFLNQHNPTLRNGMFNYAVRNFPDDFGVWELILHVIANEESTERFADVYNQAEMRFRDNPDAMLLLTREAMGMMQQHGCTNPQIAELYRQLDKRRSTPSPMIMEAVTAALAREKPRTPSYSFVQQ